MQAPIFNGDDEDQRQLRSRPEDPSFGVQAIFGAVLVLLYVLAFVLLRSI